MYDFGSRLRQWLRNSSPLFAVMLFLVLINVLTSSGYPWALFPIGAMMIPVLIMAAHTFLADSPDKADEADEVDGASELTSREARRAARQAARQGRIQDTFAPIQQTASPDLQNRLSQARAYKREIDTLVNTSQDPLRKDKLRGLANDVATWMKTVEDMIGRIDAFKRNSVVQNDLATVPDSVRRLTQQLNAETDPRVKATIERTLATRADQLHSLQQLQSLMRQSEAQLESSVAALGTIYSQVLATQSTNQVADFGQLSSELDEESKRLRDQLEALEEVKLGREKANLG